MCDISEAKADNSHVPLAAQSQLIPRSPDMHPNIHIFGALASSYIPPGWNPETSHPYLCKFLKEGPPPTVITYGSMLSQGVASSITRAHLSGLRDAAVKRIVLIPGNADLGLQHLSESSDASLLSWASEHVFVTSGNVQYAGLFPQCEMVFCHCGAGTTSVALASGVPILGTPIMADQIYFAELIDRMKLGHRVGSVGLPSITAERVRNAVHMGRDVAVRNEVASLRAENKTRYGSVEKACRLLESI